MNHCIVQIAAILLVITTSGCVETIDLVEVAKASRDRRAGPLPESEWNRFGFWDRVGNSPPSFIPKGYPRSAPRTEKAGTRVADKWDGKRLFTGQFGDFFQT